MKRIFIDPGHGGSDPGASANGLTESEVVLDVSLRLADILRASGHKASMSRIDDTAVPVNDRWQQANEWKADLFVSVHANAGGGTGVETLVPTASPNNPSRDLAAARRLAEYLSGSLGSSLGMRVRRGNGVMLETETRHGTVGVLRNTAMTAVLVEIGFVDAPAGSPDVEIMRGRRGDIAGAIAEGLERFIGNRPETASACAEPSLPICLAWPVPGFGRITSPFGMRTMNGVQEMHRGIDIGRNLSPPMPIEGATVVAAADGIVAASLSNPTAGNMVVIDHGSGVQTRYLHNEANLVSQGQSVRQGDAIARVGSTGRSTAPHLHFDVLVDGEFIDPALHVSPDRQAAAATAAPAVDAGQQSPSGLARVRVGSFAGRAGAESLKAGLRGMGYRDAFVAPGPPYSVQVGAFGNRANAESLAAELRDKGFEAAVV